MVASGLAVEETTAVAKEGVGGQEAEDLEAEGSAEGLAEAGDLGAEGSAKKKDVEAEGSAEAEGLGAVVLEEAVVGWVVEQREWEEGWEAEVADLVEAGAGWAEAGSEAADSVADLAVGG